MFRTSGAQFKLLRKGISCLEQRRTLFVENLEEDKDIFREDVKREFSPLVLYNIRTKGDINAN